VAGGQTLAVLSKQKRKRKQKQIRLSEGHNMIRYFTEISKKKLENTKKLFLFYFIK
jgi:hypothetical protein